MRQLCPRVFLISNKSRKWSCLALYFKEVELRKTTLKIENLKNMWCNFDHISLEGKNIQFAKIKIKTNINISNNINVSNNLNINKSTAISLKTFKAGPAPDKDLVDCRNWTEIPRTVPFKKKKSLTQQIIAVCLVKMIELSTLN